MKTRIALLAVGVWFFVAVAAFGALSNKDVNLIKIAFQNGYVAALGLSIEQFQRLKSDNATMQKFVEDASENYLKRVKELNK